MLGAQKKRHGPPSVALSHARITAYGRVAPVRRRAYPFVAAADAGAGAAALS